MVLNKLKSAAEAAGYAMVNPEDFAGDPRPHLIRDAPAAQPKSDEPTKQEAPSRWWPSLDMFSFSGGKATA